MQKQHINIKISQYFDDVFEYDFPQINKFEIDPSEILTKVVNYLSNFIDDFKGYQQNQKLPFDKMLIYSNIQSIIDRKIYEIKRFQQCQDNVGTN